eukprot:scaffold262_cov164-Ochromonas_danica.AAC.12
MFKFCLLIVALLCATHCAVNGESRKKVVVETKRAIVAANEEKFQAEVFKLTTDEDMPAYTGFDFN